MGRKSTVRGKRFEATIEKMLRELEAKYPGFVEINTQLSITLFTSEERRPDFELVYRLEQEHRELIEVQSRNRSSSQIVDKIRSIKAHSSRNRFCFVFDDPECLSSEHKNALEGDGVMCLSPSEFATKLQQLDEVLAAVTNRDGKKLAEWREVFAEGAIKFTKSSLIVTPPMSLIDADHVSSATPWRLPKWIRRNGEHLFHALHVLHVVWAILSVLISTVTSGIGALIHAIL